MSEKVKIELHPDILEGQLRNIINHEHRDLISKAIIGSLAFSETGLQNLVTSLAGYVYDPQEDGWTIGSEVTCRKSVLSSWDWDESRMIERQLLINDTVRVVIEETNPYRKNCIKVSYSYLKGDGDLLIPETSWVGLDSLTKK